MTMSLRRPGMASPALASRHSSVVCFRTRVSIPSGEDIAEESCARRCASRRPRKALQFLFEVLIEKNLFCENRSEILLTRPRCRPMSHFTSHPHLIRPSPFGVAFAFPGNIPEIQCRSSSPRFRDPGARRLSKRPVVSESIAIRVSTRTFIKRRAPGPAFESPPPSSARKPRCTRSCARWKLMRKRRS